VLEILEFANLDFCPFWQALFFAKRGLIPFLTPFKKTLAL